MGHLLDKLTILKHYARVRLRHFNSRDDLLAWQDRQVQAFLKKVVPQSPFYRHYYEGMPFEAWQSFPLVNKTIMMEHLDTLNTAELRKADLFDLALKAETTRDFNPMIDGYAVGLSSGTSGNRGVFVASPVERQKWAGFIIAKVLPEALFSVQRVAFFLRANSNIYTTVASRRTQFVYFDLLEPPRQHIGRLNTLQPTVLAAPPSMLRFLAQAQREDALRISPRKILSVAEVLDPLDQALIEDVFQQRLHQVYQATEGFLGSTCEYGTLHLHEDLIAVQKDVLNADLRKFSPIVTDFNRTTQPIIRYRLDDVLTEKAEACQCGLPHMALEQIEGRCDDVFYFPAIEDDGWVMLFPDFIRRAVIRASEQITAYRVEQLAPDAVAVYLQVEASVREQVQGAVAREIRTLLAGRGAHMPVLSFEPLPEETPTVSKRRRVVRKFPAAFPIQSIQ